MKKDKAFHQTRTTGQNYLLVFIKQLKLETKTTLLYYVSYIKSPKNSHNHYIQNRTPITKG